MTAQTERPRRLTLGALVHGSGGHIAGWGHPDARPDGQLDFPFHADLARTLERGRFDALFVADVVASRGHQLDSLSRTGRAEHFEPLTLLAALSLVTEHIGLAATATTTYNHPFHIARKFASLDHLSAGRAGWNVVTSVAPLEAANFGHDTHLAHELRYRRADEFVQVVKALWDSFDDDAVVRDKATGRYYDPAGLRTPHHRGEHFAVRGPLNISRAPQGHPVLFQAGSCETGREFAARHGEVLFTTQHELGAAQAFYADVKARAAAHGRDPDQVLVWPGLTPLVAPTEADARRRLAELQDLIHDDVARRLVQDHIGDIDLTGHPVDGPLPDIPDTNRSRSRRELLLKSAHDEKLTMRELAHRLAAGSVVAGTPEQIADHIETWFRARAADGFNVSFPYLPGPAEDFVDHVVPLLQQRGLFPNAYEGTTLRENLGLSRPVARARHLEEAGR
ncbi:LLM class flavin-dependent oxidoreductase [Streptomyces sp. Ag109_G2-15]|uniref:LLM class flavin-dependent oxidoreductase n=1 Tax=Streptomyces sp. Ag109_G2-15 TaxID=1938850 RepID=UPI000BC9C494|nr:LLM class flavin-dependent oxidoreductase [Streptomyces sp. Ag109_G2-15]SOE06678.1 FMN-dependent oxidoreductase, nitrilotriacetate monooxygenase family [Streptomyces sp. Ag109_G2-15]